MNFFFCPKPKNADMMHRCRAEKRAPDEELEARRVGPGVCADCRGWAVSLRLRRVDGLQPRTVTRTGSRMNGLLFVQACRRVCVGCEHTVLGRRSFVAQGQSGPPVQLSLFGVFHSSRFWPCLDPKYFPKLHYAKRRFPVTSKYRHMYGVVNVDEIKN
jgi:hypothetical protein